ncbi:ABC transporter permease [Dethiobacter alkaliphilus]|uniref:ABC transporter permease n=1 Tax=Dethiobacter alkaliphilus TaxID=427926 RepID=UPI0022270926|nr:ABC transporter permease [Dethiobacter alkaliphilus]MCW3490941.1 ABC transporter permease [Dethiobacter alkaliphilus]
MELFQFILSRREMIQELAIEHFYLVLLAGAISILIGVILGVAITYNRVAARIVLGVCQVLMVIPSFAMLGFLLPFFGIGFRTGVVALILYCLLPVTQNTYIGILEIPPSVLESAKGMGMSPFTILWKIKIPLALPVIIAGFRTAMIMIVGIAAIAAFIGAGGLGEMIFQGISRSQANRILTGAIFIAMIALLLDVLMSRLEEYLMARVR